MHTLTLGFDFLSVNFTNDSLRQPDPKECVLWPHLTNFIPGVSTKSEVHWQMYKPRPAYCKCEWSVVLRLLVRCLLVAFIFIGTIALKKFYAASRFYIC